MPLGLFELVSAASYRARRAIVSSEEDRLEEGGSAFGDKD